MLEHLALQDVGFTGVLDSALKWVIKNKAKCIDELQEVDVVKTRLDKIKDALVTEKNEEAAAVAVGAATSDDPPDEAADEAIRCANPAKYAEHGVEYWQAYAAQTVKTYIRLAPEPRTQAGLAELIEGSHVNMCKGLEQKNAVLILLDLDLLCESVTRPMDRRPVLPDGIVQRLLRGSMQGRGAQKNKDDEYCQPVAGDVYFLLDGKREHLHKTLLEAFCPSGKKAGLTDCSVRVFNLFLSEQSLRARKAIVRGSDPISQRQCMLCVTASPLVPDTIPEKAHTKYQGTNRGDVIGLIHMPALEGAWQLPFSKKKAVYADRLVSGDTQDKDARSQHRDDSLEPTFYNFMPELFFQNLYVTMSGVGVIDLSAGPGEAAKAALVMKRPYLGLCLTEGHVTLLYRHLVNWALSEMGSEGSPLYSSKYAECVGNKTAAAAQGAQKKKAEQPEKPQKPQGGQKRPKRSIAESDEGSDGVKRKPKKPKQKKQNQKVSSSESDSRSSE
jgi:hypothetical protein